jgi:hypothetical protein
MSNETSSQKETNTNATEAPATQASGEEKKEVSGKKGHSVYPSISAMIDSSGDYASDNGTFQIISENPLHIRISRISMPEVSLDQLKYEAKEGIVYIAYTAFASTDIEEITITAVPKMYDAANNKDLGFNKQASYTATINRDIAQKVMQKIAGVNKFDDLLGEDVGNGVYFPDSPNDAFEKLKSEKNIDEVLSMLTNK